MLRTPVEGPGRRAGEPGLGVTGGLLLGSHLQQTAHPLPEQVVFQWLNPPHTKSMREESAGPKCKAEAQSGE